MLALLNMAIGIINVMPPSQLWVALVGCVNLVAAGVLLDAVVMERRKRP